MWKSIFVGVCVGLLGGIFLIQLPAQEKEGLGERLGEKLDKGLRQLSTELRQEWTQVRQSVERMSVQGRVYSRLRWDKAIDVSTLDIQMQDKDTVVLHGTVASAMQQQKAIQLAQDTVGVGKVIDKTTLSKPPVTK